MQEMEYRAHERRALVRPAKAAWIAVKVVAGGLVLCYAIALVAGLVTCYEYMLM